MISSSYNIEEFIHAIESKDYFDSIYSADQEAAEAERRLFHSRKNNETMQKGGERYVGMLKDFISFMRYNVKLANRDRPEYRLFYAVQENLEKRRKYKKG